MANRTVSGLHVPPQFLPTPGKPPIQWELWIEMLNNYFGAIVGENFTPQRKACILKTNLGPEGFRILKLIPTAGIDFTHRDANNVITPDDEYQRLVKILHSHFRDKRDKRIARFDFRRRRQQPGESIDDYIIALRHLLPPCQYNDLGDEMIHFQLIEKTHCKEIQDKLLLHPELTLDEAITMARQVEEALAQSKTLQSSDTSAVQFVNKVTPVNNDTRPTQATQATQKAICFRCGSEGHKANYMGCKARDKECRKCRKVGHFANVCRSESNATTVKQVEPENDNTDNQVYVLTSKCQPYHTGFYCEIEINDKTCRMLVDTGSPVTLMSFSDYQKIFKNISLQPSTLEMTSYTRDTIPLLGKFSAKVKYKDKLCYSDIYVVKDGFTVMGQDLLDVLDLNIHTDTMRFHTTDYTQERNHSDTDSKECVPPMRIERQSRPAQQLQAQVNATPSSHPTPTHTKDMNCDYLHTKTDTVKPTFTTTNTTKPWSKVTMNISGPIQGAPENSKFIAVLTCEYSKYPYIGFMNNDTSENLQTFMDTVFAKEGLPKELITTNATTFRSDMFQSFCKTHLVKHTTVLNDYDIIRSDFRIQLHKVIDSAILNRKSPRAEVRDFIGWYRTTPHHVTGVAPRDRLCIKAIII